MPKPFGITLFCDDIRREVGGKHTYVGVYGGDMTVVSNEPALLPILSMAAMLFTPPDFTFTSVKVQVLREVPNEGDQVLVEQEIPGMQSREKGKGLKHNINFSLSPFLVDRDFKLKVKAFFDDATEVRLGSLSVKLKPSANTPPKPSTSAE